MSVSFETLFPGDGKRRVQQGDIVSVHYTIKLNDGKVCDTSKNRGRPPFLFMVGNGTVVEAWDKVLPSMTVGQKVLITSSSDAAYGARGIPPGIPGNATVRFEVELLAIHE